MMTNDYIEADDWREMREEQQERRAKRLEPRTEEILTVANQLGYSTKMLTPYQIRITNGSNKIDIYPIHMRWCNLRTKKRGQVRGMRALRGFLASALGKAAL